MNTYLELAILLLSILCSLILSQLARDYNCRLIQEKFFGLLTGLVLGTVFSLLNKSFLSWFPDYFPILVTFVILEKVHTMPRALVFNRLGSIILMTVLGGLLTLVLSSLILSLILNNLDHSQSISSIIQLVCCFLVPGSSLGAEKDFEYQLFINSQIFSVLLAYPLHSSIQTSSLLYFRLLALGLIIGLVVGIIGSLLIRTFRLSKSWTPFEVLTSGLLACVSGLASLSINGSPIVSVVVSCLLLIKYGYISDGSQVTRNNLYLSLSVMIEIVVQVWMGVKLIQLGVDYQVASLLVFTLIILLVAYLGTLVVAYICKLKTIKVFDCISFAIGGFRGTTNAYLIYTLPEQLQAVALLGCAVYSLLGTGLSYFLPSGKEESSYLISSNPCSKLKMILQNFEETYLVQIFVKETVEKSIMSPKFNENSQRFEAGIQMRPENRDETSRELQALNLNITESEVQGVLQLK